MLQSSWEGTVRCVSVSERAATLSQRRARRLEMRWPTWGRLFLDQCASFKPGKRECGILYLFQNIRLFGCLTESKVATWTYTRFSNPSTTNILSLRMSMALDIFSFMLLWHNFQTNSSLGKRLISAYSSTLLSIITGESGWDLHSACHTIASTIRSRDKCMHASMLAFT